MILSGASSIELKRKAIEEGMVSLRMSGLQKIREGATTLEEVLRETVPLAFGSEFRVTSSTFQVPGRGDLQHIPEPGTRKPEPTIREVTDPSLFPSSDVVH
jgi:hypothetical protein